MYISQPLADVFSSTPKGAPNPFALSIANASRTPRIHIAEDKPRPATPRPVSPQKAAAQPQVRTPVPATDSGYHGSPSQELADVAAEDAEQTPVTSPHRGWTLPTSAW